jgi:hypothetical protein
MNQSHFENELAKIREQGYTMVIESRIKRAFSFVAPIFDDTGKLVDLPWIYDLRVKYKDILHFWPFDSFDPIEI